MEIRTLTCKACKSASNIKALYKGKETYTCELCGALNKITYKSGKYRYKVAAWIAIAGLSYCVLSGGFMGLLPGTIIFMTFYFGTLLAAKISDWFGLL